MIAVPIRPWCQQVGIGGHFEVPQESVGPGRVGYAHKHSKHHGIYGMVAKEALRNLFE